MVKVVEGPIDYPHAVNCCGAVGTSIGAADIALQHRARLQELRPRTKGWPSLANEKL